MWRRMISAGLAFRKNAEGTLARRTARRRSSRAQPTVTREGIASSRWTNVRGEIALNAEHSSDGLERSLVLWHRTMPAGGFTAANCPTGLGRAICVTHLTAGVFAHHYWCGRYEVPHSKGAPSNGDLEGSTVPQKGSSPDEPPPAPSSESAFKHTETSLDSIPTPSLVTNTARRTAHRGEPAESIIASDITIEGKIEGAGHIRLAGRFKGDVHIQGDLTIDPGAKLTGSVRANTVIISGEIEGNIESAQRVELLDSGVLTGDLKAGTVSFAAGSRMRGRAEFGWGDEGQRASRARDSRWGRLASAS